MSLMVRKMKFVVDASPKSRNQTSLHESTLRNCATCHMGAIQPEAFDFQRAQAKADIHHEADKRAIGEIYMEGWVYECYHTKVSN